MQISIDEMNNQKNLSQFTRENIDPTNKNFPYLESHVPFSKLCAPVITDCNPKEKSCVKKIGGTPLLWCGNTFNYEFMYDRVLCKYKGEATKRCTLKGTWYRYVIFIVYFISLILADFDYIPPIDWLYDIAIDTLLDVIAGVLTFFLLGPIPAIIMMGLTIPDAFFPSEILMFFEILPTHLIIAIITMSLQRSKRAFYEQFLAKMVINKPQMQLLEALQRKPKEEQMIIEEVPIPPTRQISLEENSPPPIEE